MTGTISAKDRTEIMRLFDADYHGWTEEDQPYSLSVPDGWKVSHDMPPWVVVSPQSLELPEQGWKVHISTTPDTAQQTLVVVSQVAFVYGTSFKYLAGLAELRRMSGKYADRSSAGKFIALYPEESLLESLLSRLDNVLSGFDGPYILSDVQYRTSPVYVRYGGYVNICDVWADGTERLCFRGPDGELVEDKRDPILQIPDFVNVPDCLREVVSVRLDPTDDALDRLMQGYDFIEALHFSNGGGVYHLRNNADGREVIMKEGRPCAGWDPRGTDAIGRLRREAATLKALFSSGAVPAVIDMRTAGGHLFLFEEKVDGQDLHSWTARNYPHNGSDADRKDYSEKALAILDGLDRAVSSAHAMGIAIMDLQPHNIIVTPENQVRMIDLESSCPINDVRPQACLGTPGYVPSARSYTPAERDRYAIFKIALEMFHPAASMSVLSDDVSRSIENTIDQLYPSSVVSRIDRMRKKVHPLMVRTLLSNPAPETWMIHDGSDLKKFGDNLDDRKVLSGLVEGLHAVRTGRALDAENPSFYPLTETSYSGTRQIAIEHGLSGVMLALGPDDLNAEEDLNHLQAAAQAVRRAGAGLMNGMLGVCLVLASRGRCEEARDLYAKHCEKECASNNISLRSGLSGRALGTLLLADIVDDPRLRSRSEILTSRLHRLLKKPPEELDSPESFTRTPLGLLDGWSGAALALAFSARLLHAPALYEQAIEAVDLDMGNMVFAEDGSLQAVDGSRTMPYLADGSAGLAFALSSIPVQYRKDYSVTINNILKACQGSCMLPGLYHGLVGLILVSTLLNREQHKAAHRRPQLNELPPFIMCPGNSRAILLPGRDGEHLSIEFANGSAGALFALRFMRAHLAATSLSDPAMTWDLAGIVEQLRKGGE